MLKKQFLGENKKCMPTVFNEINLQICNDTKTSRKLQLIMYKNTMI